MNFDLYYNVVRKFLINEISKNYINIFFFTVKQQFWCRTWESS